MNFGLYLRELRRNRRMTQEQLAAAVGVDFTYVSKVENGRVDPPSEKTIRKMAAALGADPEDLLTHAAKLDPALKDVAAAEPELALLLRTIAHKPLRPDQYQRMREIAEEEGP